MKGLLISEGSPGAALDIDAELLADIASLEDLTGVLMSMGMDAPSVPAEYFGEGRGGGCTHLHSDEAVRAFLTSAGAAPLRLCVLAPLHPWRPAADPSAPDGPLQSALAAVCPASSPAGQVANASAFASRLAAIARHMSYYRDPALRAKALATIPVARLAFAAHAAAGAGPPPPAPPSALGAAFRLELLKGLLAWFKHEFFRWVDKPPCDACGAPTASSGQSALPTPVEVSTGGAGHVELYRCTSPACAHATRFPRYNSPSKLLDTRRGRCGEWAGAFTACALALGFPARHVTDFSDHVWTEVQLHPAAPWTHVDACEAALDKPLLYEAGWNKSLSFIFAAGTDAFRDVTQRYTAKWRAAVLPARAALGLPEPAIAALCCAVEAGQRLRDGRGLRLSGEEEAMRAAEEEALRAGAAAAEAGAAAPDAGECVGRTTGSEEWRRERGEMGVAAAAGGGAGSGAGGCAASATPTSSVTASPAASGAGALDMRAQMAALFSLYTKGCGRGSGKCASAHCASGPAGATVPNAAAAKALSVLSGGGGAAAIVAQCADAAAGEAPPASSSMGP